jgi:hypothetical protein
MLETQWKTVRQFLQELNLELPYDIIPSIEVYLKEMKAGTEQVLTHQSYSIIIHNGGKLG